MRDSSPDAIIAADTRYWYVSVSKLAPDDPPSRIGGDITPASMARECCRPNKRASRTGILSSTPKKGADWRARLVNEMRGVKRKA